MAKLSLNYAYLQHSNYLWCVLHAHRTLETSQGVQLSAYQLARSPVDAVF